MVLLYWQSVFNRKPAFLFSARKYVIPIFKFSPPSYSDEIKTIKQPFNKQKDLFTKKNNRF